MTWVLHSVCYSAMDYGKLISVWVYEFRLVWGLVRLVTFDRRTTLFNLNVFPKVFWRRLQVICGDNLTYKFSHAKTHPEKQFQYLSSLSDSMWAKDQNQFFLEMIEEYCNCIAPEYYNGREKLIYLRLFSIPSNIYFGMP